jgi:hypothetical protein
MLRKVLSRVNTRTASRVIVVASGRRGRSGCSVACSYYGARTAVPVFMICGGGGGFGCVASFVASMRSCSASFSPVLVGVHEQEGVE